MTGLLRDWYGGEDRASLEVLDHLPGVEDVGSLIDEIVEENMSPEQAAIRKLIGNWAEIVGGQTAAVTRPVRVADRVVIAEVNHPAYLRELRAKSIVELIKDKINRACGKGFCVGVRFVPAGRG